MKQIQLLLFCIVFIHLTLLLCCISSKYNAACGRSTFRGKNSTLSDKKGGPKDAPWNVAIYSSETMSEDPKFICGGTLISEEIVVSAAHYFFDEVSQIKYDARLFTIMVGKATVDFNKMDFNTTQKFSVKSINFKYPYFVGTRINYASDIAILQLSDKITVGEDVMPACIHWNETDRFRPSEKVTYGKLSGFGAAQPGNLSHVLLTENLPYIDYTDCVQTVREDFKYSLSLILDKFCAGNETGHGARVVEEGGGIVFKDEKDGLFYLRGVFNCREKGSIAVFTDVGHYMSWINEIVAQVHRSALNEDTSTTSEPTRTVRKTKTIIPDVNQCTLPPITPDKTYTIACPYNLDGCGLNPGEKTKEYTILSSHCNPGYAVYKDGEVEMLSYCIQSNWTSIVKCRKICEDLSSLDLDSTCSKYLNGARVPCTGVLLEGAVFVRRCKPQYHTNHHVSYRNVKCEEDGTWNEEFSQCLPTCGRSTTSGKIGSIKDAPWNVAIYSSETSKDPKFICGGTLIRADLVVSAARCFLNQTSQKKIDARLFTIMVGKATIDFRMDFNMTEKFSVKSIYFADSSFDGVSIRNSSDLAILQLYNKITESEYILPACIRWNEKNRFDPGEKVAYGKLSGFGTESGIISPVLLTENFTYINYTDCMQRVSEDFKNSISSDKFCAGNKRGSGARVINGGGGLVFEDVKDGLFYLRGVLCNRERGESSIAAFTDLGLNIAWIKTIVSYIDTSALNEDTSITSKLASTTVTTTTIIPNTTTTIISNTTTTTIPNVRQCTLPPITPDKTYIIICQGKRNCSAKPGEKVIEYTTLSLRCNPGFSVYQNGQVPWDNNDAMISHCFRGNWSNVIQCKKTCNDLRSLDLDFTCSKYLHGPKVPCNGTLLEGAAVLPRCKPHYHVNYPVNYRHVICQKDGSWNKEFFQCSPTCGISTFSVVELILYGQKGTPKDAPWNVAIYSNETNKDPQFICGGTLISPQLVVSATHCFVDQASNKKLDTQLFTIMVGKATVDFNKMDLSTTQKLLIKSIHFADVYFGGEKNGYDSDIAILELSEIITFSEDVLPACIRFNETGRFVPKGKVTYGRLSGFGATEHEEVSSVLRTANLPYIEISDCKRRVSEDFKYSVSFDKFCAGNETGSGARVGDSGGGLVFMDEKEGFFYLRGVVSNRERGESSIAAFTDIGLHMEWMKKVIANVSKSAHD